MNEDLHVQFYSAMKDHTLLHFVTQNIQQSLSPKNTCGDTESIKSARLVKIAESHGVQGVESKYTIPSRLFIDDVNNKNYFYKHLKFFY